MIGIISANHLRPEVLHLWCLSIQRLRKLGIPLKAAVAADSNQGFVRDYDIDFLPRPNNPVSQKFQYALNHIQKYHPKAIMVLPSDDLLSDSAFLALHNKVCFEDFDSAIMSEVFFFHPTVRTQDELLYFKLPKLATGAGLLINSRVLDRLKWKLYIQNKDRGLGGMIYKRLNSIKATIVPIDEPLMVDIKTETNMNSYKFWEKKPTVKVNSNLFFDFISPEEREVLTKMIAHG